MRTRSLVVLIVIVAVLAAGVWVMASGDHNAIADWFAEMHGRPASRH